MDTVLACVILGVGTIASATVSVMVFPSSIVDAMDTVFVKMVSPSRLACPIVSNAEGVFPFAPIVPFS